MKTIKILGTGCLKCKSMTNIVNEVIFENNIEASVEKVEDIEDIMKFNVMSTPALVINNAIVTKGRVPLKSEVLAFLNK